MVGTSALFLPWYLAATGSVFALSGIYRNIGFLRDDFSPLFLAVTFLCLVLPLEDRIMEFLGDDSRNGFRTQHSSVWQWTHFWRQPTVPFGRISLVFQRFACFNSGYTFMRQTTEAGFSSAQCLVRQWLWEMASWSFLNSAQCLVRQSGR